uniref:Biogenesis of lysosome-related organelles complex 1 subunit 2 n=1 Tax=Peronospora matthiolae TaxID=2874970 RepID=A0AAV1UYC9_9STRA
MEKAEVDELRELTQRVCANVAAYAGAQLDGSLESMQLMATVVNTVNAKYVGMRREIKSVGKLSKVLEARATALREKMDVIDDLDEELAELEDMVDQLEKYTGSLEVKFHQVC